MKLERRPLVLIVRDGWGHNPYPEWNHANAVHLARTPVDRRLTAEYPHVLIHTSGEDVGLPAGVMGNSEVGHQNIGAGRVVDQEILRITKAIRDGSFFTHEALCGAIEHCSRTGGNLHIMGLCSDAGVHSVLDHAYAVLELAKRGGLGAKASPRDMSGGGSTPLLESSGTHGSGTRASRRSGSNADRVLFHAFGDGRDSPPNSGIGFIREVEAKMRQLGVGRVATVIGRYYAMDRDNRWDRVEKAYRLLTEANGKHVNSAEAVFQSYYDRPTEPSRRGDEFIEPTVVGKPVPITAGDAVIFFNFRGDRPRELVKAFVYDEFPYVAADASRRADRADGEKITKSPDRQITKSAPAPALGSHSPTHGFDRGKRIDDLYFCTMCDYEQGLPVEVAFKRPPKLKNILGAYSASLGLRQFRCAETEKYPHVTFFFNDYRDEPFEGEDRRIIPSPRDVSTYDQKPEMSAYEVTDEMLRRVESDRYDLMILNYANGDMVGHTGNLAAAIKAVEVVDECVGRVVDAAMARGGAVIVTADHGNCEQMIDPATGGPHTAHTTYDVDLILVDDRFKRARLREGGRLADIAPTLLALGAIEQPAEMTGRSLFRA